MRLYQIGLVSTTSKVTSAQLGAVAAALQTQVLRDLMPEWDVTATVDAFDSLNDVPVTYWPVIVADNIGYDAAGIHLDENYTPYALVNYSNRWSLTASHEVLEMLVDPFGVRLHPAKSLEPSQAVAEYLVEVCDPSEAVGFSYLINGIVVSDFYLPSFFDPVETSRVRYSFKDVISRPLQVLDGGYLSWRDPVTNHWWQQTWFGGAAPALVDLGVFAGNRGQSYRSWLDQTVRKDRHEAIDGVPEGGPDHDALVAAYAIGSQESEARQARATRLRQEIEEKDRK
jgi:hypothetical protein